MRHRSHASLVVHAVWTTLHRRPCLRVEKDVWLHDRIRREAEKQRSLVLAVGNASDHVHVVTTLSQTVPLSTLMQQLKGGTSHAWNRLLSEPDDPRQRLVWQDGYWAESCDPRQIDALARYVEDQRSAHKDSSFFEHWIGDSPQEARPWRA